MTKGERQAARASAVCREPNARLILILLPRPAVYASRRGARRGRAPAPLSVHSPTLALGKADIALLHYTQRPIPDRSNALRVVPRSPSNTRDASLVLSRLSALRALFLRPSENARLSAAASAASARDGARRPLPVVERLQDPLGEVPAAHGAQPRLALEVARAGRGEERLRLVLPRARADERLGGLRQRRRLLRRRRRRVCRGVPQQRGPAVASSMSCSGLAAATSRTRTRSAGRPQPGVLVEPAEQIRPPPVALQV